MGSETAGGAERIARVLPEIRRIHLIGVGGSAMAALAGMLAGRGYRVSGSDLEIYEPSASLLRRLKIDLRRPYSATNLEPSPDLVVVGNVVARSNPEAQTLLESGIPYLSMPEALWHLFLRDKRVLMVAGTHGKTTTTAIIAHVLTQAGRDPSMLVGGMALDFENNYRLGRGPDFVIEGDEYDTAFFDKGPKFLHYHPQGAIITAVEFDHADIYRDLEHVIGSFRALAAQMESGAVLVVSADFPHALEAVTATRAKRISFGLKDGEFRAAAVRIAPDGARFAIAHKDNVIVPELFLAIGGRMNIANALGAWILLKEFGLADREIAEGLATFRGVARRQQIVGEIGGVTLIDDFAHHPTAIAATLEAVAERFADRRILAAFEPRSNTARRAVFQRDFAAAFDRASRVFLAPVYFKENDPIPPDERLDIVRLAGGICGRGPKAQACKSIEEMVEAIAAEAKSGDIVLAMSNGPFGNLLARVGEALRNRPGRS